MSEDIAIQLSALLKVRKGILKADVKDLAWAWEMAANEFNKPSAGEVVRLSFSIIRAYLRGRNIRMGSSQGYDRHSMLLILFELLIFTEVLSSPYLYTAIYGSGLTSLERLHEAMSGPSLKEGHQYPSILEQAEGILKNKNPEA